MFQAVGKKVIYLKRIAMGELCLDQHLALGQYRELTKDEIELLKQR
jgi:16S rRNA pseudouridine516 synthase